jgi:hypothetical protein
MRAFTLSNGGRYILSYPDEKMPTTAFQVTAENASKLGDRVLLGLPWSGSVPVAGRQDSGYGGETTLQRVAQGVPREFLATGTSIADVLNDSSGAAIWQDPANNRVWVKEVGGLNWDVNAYTAMSDGDLSRAQVIRLWAGP